MFLKYLLIILLSSSCQSISQSLHYYYPEISPKPVIEEIHGITLVDQYRHIENTKDSTVSKWFEAQSSFTDSVLNSYDSIDSIEEKIKSVNMATTSWAYSVKQDDSGNLYYLKYREGDPNYILFSRDKQTGLETLLYNPLDYKSETGKEYYLDYIEPSWDGKFVALSLRHSMDFTSEVVLLETATKKLTNDLVLNSRPVSFGGLNWLPDSSGFTYLFFPVIEKDKTGYMTNSVTLLHYVNNASSIDTNIFGSENALVEPNFLPIIKIASSSDQYAIGHVIDNTHYYNSYYATIKSIKSGKPQWKKLYNAEDWVYINAGKQHDDRYYYISGKDTPNFTINYVEFDFANFTDPKILVPENKQEVVKDFVLVDNGLYFTTAKNGIESSLYYSDFQTTKLVELPFVAGTLEITPNNGKGNQILIETSGWANDLTRFKVSNGVVGEKMMLAYTPSIIQFQNLVSEEITVRGHDGIEIPVSIVYDKTIGKTNRPALIRSYGAYGHNVDPHYDRMLLSWTTLGGIQVIPHIRGGGEKGKAWHEAGKKQTKSNSWNDIISVTEFLIKQGYTSKDKTILFSESAGAIAQAMAAIKRPELFRVFLARVPLLNPVRLKSGSHEQTSYTEFGDIDKPEEVPALIDMDPYYNMNRNISFPATLLFAAGKDDRLDLWETGKFIAKLQNTKKTTAPTLMKVIPDWGHESVSASAYAEMFGFALEQID